MTSPERQSYPWRHQKMCDQEVEVSDPAPLLLTGEASPGMLCPDVESAIQKRHGPAGEHAENG